MLKKESRNSASSVASISTVLSSGPKIRKKIMLMKMNIRKGGMYLTLLPSINSLVKKPGLRRSGRTLLMISESNVK